MNLSRPDLACFLAGAFFFLGCSPPKYATYTSIHKDWKTVVPGGWSIMTDQEGSHFTNTNFIGPFEPEFYLGAPSFSVRWHSYKASHRLPDGLVEYYETAEDYIDQMLKSVYGPRFELVDAEDYHRPAGISGSKVAGRDAKHFAVLSPTEVPADTKWGTSVNPETGRIGVVRLHEYVVVPAQKGFYVLVYPATRDGFKLYKPQFNAFVHGFTILAEGPPNSATGSARP